MRPDGIEDIRGARLTPNPVRERLSHVVPMTHPGGSLPQAHASSIEQGGVRASQAVPTHPWLVEIDVMVPSVHGGYERVASAAVIPIHGEIKAVEDVLRSVTEGHYTDARLRLGRVDRAGAGECPPDTDDTTVDVLPANRDDLTPPQASQEHQFGDLSPDPGHSLEDYLNLFERQRMLPGGDGRDPRTLRWRW